MLVVVFVVLLLHHIRIPAGIAGVVVGILAISTV